MVKSDVERRKRPELRRKRPPPPPKRRGGGGGQIDLYRHHKEEEGDKSWDGEQEAIKGGEGDVMFYPVRKRDSHFFHALTLHFTVPAPSN